MGTKIAYIMRGVSGSGKSTRARALADEAGIIHSTDDFFLIDGRYKFDPTRLQEFHAKNHAAFEKSLTEGIPIVICDNTNVRRWQYLPYLVSAWKAGYEVHIVSLPHPNPETAARRNVHGVPLHTIQRMIAEWEI